MVANGLYYFTMPKINLAVHSVATTTTLWHRRLSHPSSCPLQVLFPTIYGLCSSISDTYDVCPLAKQTRLSFHSSSKYTTAPFQLIHCDIWGGYHAVSICGARYFLTIVDDFTQCTWVYLMNHKSETCPFLENFFAMVKTQYQAQIKIT